MLGINVDVAFVQDIPFGAPRFEQKACTEEAALFFCEHWETLQETKKIYIYREFQPAATY